MAKTILVIIDACGYDTAKECLGFLEHMTENGQCAKYRVKAELPSMSRTNYETIMTGLTPYRHGVVNNLVVRRSLCDNLFSLCKRNGLGTAAAAFSWMSELYSKAPFSFTDDRFQLDSCQGDIDHGIFYFEDPYPDTHLYADAEFLRKKYKPDYLLVHSMGMDYNGHLTGSNSKEYRLACAYADGLIGLTLPLWRLDGYDVVVTADHGMDTYGMHGGDSHLQRIVPLYIFSEAVIPGDYTEFEISQLNVAPLICTLLGIPPSSQMIALGEIRRT